MHAGKNTTVIPCGYVDPNKLSTTQLGPGIYALNKRSNVPFVGLVGSSGFKKTISWGELAEVPCGELVTVSNASYHGGDIFISKGPDMDNRPSRITVPVSFGYILYQTVEGPINVWASSFPCDTRAAKRAYLCVDALAAFNADGSFPIYIRGRKLDGSMKTLNSLATYPPPFGPGVGFLSALEWASLSQLNYIPLGMGASAGDDTRPHCLLDAGDVFFRTGGEGTDIGDILTWPADALVLDFPVEDPPLDGPGTWYVIEYD